MKLDSAAPYLKKNVLAPDNSGVEHSTGCRGAIWGLFWCFWAVLGLFLGKKLVLHVADDVAEAGSFFEVEARGGFLHLAFQVGKFC